MFGIFTSFGIVTFGNVTFRTNCQLAPTSLQNYFSIYTFGQWNSVFLTFSFIIKGTSKKVSQGLMPLEPIYNKKTFVLMNKMFIMNTVIRFKQ